MFSQRNRKRMSRTMSRNDIMQPLIRSQPDMSAVYIGIMAPRTKRSSPNTRLPLRQLRQKSLLETRSRDSQMAPTQGAIFLIFNCGRSADGTWAAKPRWSGGGFTRVVVELADLRGHLARAIARQHKIAAEWSAPLIVDSFRLAVLTGCWAWRSSYCAGLR